MSLSNNLRLSALVSFICLVGLLLIPSDPKNALILGFSPTRMGGIIAFLGIALGAIFASYRLSQNPQRELSLQDKITTFSQRPHFHTALVGIFSVVVLVCLALLFEILVTGDEFKAQLLVRLSPFLVFLTATCIQALFYILRGDERRLWLGVIALAFVTMVAGVSLQRALLAQLENTYRLNPTLLELNQVGIATLAWFFYAWTATRPKSEGRAWLLILLFCVVLFLIQWYNFPRSYWRVKHHLAFLAPAGILSIAILTQAVFEVWQRLEPGFRNLLTRLVQVGAILALVLLAIPYFSAAQRHSQILNDSPQYTDQQDYLEFALKAHEMNYQYAGKFSQMPLYPYLQALFFQDDMDSQEFFQQGKQLNIILSLILLAGLFMIFTRYLSLVKAALLTLIIAFSLYIFKSAYFQSELLYYTLAFAGFLLMLAMIKKPTFLLALATGIVLGLAHLTKASALPGLAILVLVFSGIELVRWIRNYRTRDIDIDFARQSAVRFGLLLLSLVSFLAVIYPYIRIANQKFGNYFYNVNTSVYVWYDDFTEAKAVDELYNFADTWSAEIPRDEIPTMQTYFQTHSLEQISERVLFGIRAQLNNIWSSYSLTNYLVSYLVLLLLTVLADPGNAWQSIRHWWFLIAFGALYFAIYLAAFTWYAPISPEPRFTYGLLIPAMMTIFVSLRELVANQKRSNGDGPPTDLRLLVNSANFIIFLTLMVNIYLVLSERIYFDRYGA